jgi:thioredoxin reductase
VLVSINKKGEETELFSEKDSFPIKITLVDKDDTVTDYILITTGKEKFILQKPFSNKAL